MEVHNYTYDEDDFDGFGFINYRVKGTEILESKLYSLEFFDP